MAVQGGGEQSDQSGAHLLFSLFCYFDHGRLLRYGASIDRRYFLESANWLDGGGIGIFGRTRDRKKPEIDTPMERRGRYLEALLKIGCHRVGHHLVHGSSYGYGESVMRYLYHANAGDARLALEGDFHHYLFRVRRHRAGETIHLRNLDDGILYSYRIEELNKKAASLRLTQKSELAVEARRKLHIGWCVIDPKTIEKTLPMLNEIGVEKITFIYCKRSQKDFKIDVERLEKILINSSQQCGRSKMMQLRSAASLEEFLTENPESWMLNFSTKRVDESCQNIHTVVVGPEGGFADEECGMIPAQRVVGFESALILKSESAVCAVSSKILL